MDDAGPSLEDPSGTPALSVLRRCGFAEPERAARELGLLVADPLLGAGRAVLLRALPEAFARLPDPDWALAQLERFVRAGGAGTLAALARAPAECTDAFFWALGGSPFLAEQVIRNPQWASWLTRPRQLARPRRARQVALAVRRSLAGAPREAAGDALRLARRREVALVAIRDLMRLSSVSATLEALTSVADALVEVALDVAGGGRVPGLLVLGLGKLGGGELNFSSDIDLVYVHSTFGPGSAAGAHQRAHAAARQLTTLLGETTHEGLVYRVDLRLRPEGRAGALVHSLDAAEEYYGGGRAADWERLALVKARRVAGDRELGRDFAKRVAPFVWQRPFGAEAVRKVLRLKQESDRRLASRGLLERHVKLGRGGIREIELLTQVLQVRQGGPLRHARARGTLHALEALRTAGALAAPEHDALQHAYLFLRDVENKLQMAHDTQTHVLPEDEHALQLLAARLGLRRPGDGRDEAAGRLRRELGAQTAIVRGLYEELLGRGLSERTVG